MTYQRQCQQVAGWLASSQQSVVFTGAGISTESGIPDFRSPGGVWSRNRPVMFQDFLADRDSRREYWRQKSEAQADFAAAQPNAGHRVLADWERGGVIRGVITQNIDGLHQEAGSRDVLELHGTARAIQCLACGARSDPAPAVEHFLSTGNPPECVECGGPLKHATVSFGQQLPEDVIEEADQWSRQCDLFLAMGSSLVVEPAASLPRTAVAAGAKLVIINRDPTDQDEAAGVVLNHSIGETLARIDRLLSLGP